jgi:fluoroacetyl-CoA thioesterase
VTAAELFAGPDYLERMTLATDDSADRWGNRGLLVLSTPAMLGRVEQVCVRWVEPRLPADRITVGVSVEMSHLAPLPLPAEVEVRLHLAHTEGIVFDVDFEVLWPQGGLEVLGRGRHRRAVVDRQRFTAGIEARRAILAGRAQ